VHSWRVTLSEQTGASVGFTPQSQGLTGSHTHSGQPSLSLNQLQFRPQLEVNLTSVVLEAIRHTGASLHSHDWQPEDEIFFPYWQNRGHFTSGHGLHLQVLQPVVGSL